VKKYSVVSLATLFLASIFMAAICWADNANKLAILKTIEGNWNSEILGMDGKKYIRPWVFRVDGNDFLATITRPGMQPEACKVPLEEISHEGGVLKVNIVFPPYTSKANLVISNGNIKGTAWRQARPPGPSDIVFSRR
jgi:hypothetical protein